MSPGQKKTARPQSLRGRCRPSRDRRSGGNPITASGLWTRDKIIRGDFLVFVPEGMLAADFCKLGADCWLLEAGYLMLSAGFKMLDAKSIGRISSQPIFFFGSSDVGIAWIATLNKSSQLCNNFLPSSGYYLHSRYGPVLPTMWRVLYRLGAICYSCSNKLEGISAACEIGKRGFWNVCRKKSIKKSSTFWLRWGSGSLLSPPNWATKTNQHLWTVNGKFQVPQALKIIAWG